MGLFPREINYVISILKQYYLATQRWQQSDLYFLQYLHPPVFAFRSSWGLIIDLNSAYLMGIVVFLSSNKSI